MEDGIYYLANSKEVIGFEKKFKKENRRIEVRNHMVVTNFDKKLFELDPQEKDCILQEIQMMKVIKHKRL